MKKRIINNKMKRAQAIIAIILSLASMQVSGQFSSQSIIGGNQNDEIKTIITTNDGYLYAGTSNSDSGFFKNSYAYNNSKDFWIYKTNKSGTKLWEYKYGTSSDDILATCILTQDSGYIIAGTTSSGISFEKTDTARGLTDIWLIKIDKVGNIVWNKTFGGNGNDLVSNIIEINGNLYIGGQSTSDSSQYKSAKIKGGIDYWVIKTDGEGNQIWDKSFGGSQNELFADIAIFNSNKIILGGYSQSNISFDKTAGTIDGRFDYWILAIDTNGAKIWDKTLGTNGDQFLSKLSTQNTDILLAGTSLGDTSLAYSKSESHRGNLASEDIWIVKIDQNGNKIWDKTIGGSNSDFISSIINTSDGGSIIGSTSNSNLGFDKSESSRGGNDYWLIKLNKDGKIIWDKTIGGNKNDDLKQLFFVNKKLWVIGNSNSDAIGGDKLKANITANSTNYWIIESNEPKSKIIGRIFADFNSNCTFDSASEFNHKNYLIHNTKENTYFISYDKDYQIFTYTNDTAVLKIINLDSPLYISCGKDSIVYISKTDNYFDTTKINFPLRSNKIGQCLDINSFSSDNLSPGEWSRFQIDFQNYAFDTAFNSSANIQVDSTQIDSISSSYSFQYANNHLTFNLGKIKPFEYRTISYNVKLKSNAIIGTTLCHRAMMSPQCNLYSTQNYDSSNIIATTKCLSKNKIELTLVNIGKDQSDSGTTVPYVDELILKANRIKLPNNGVFSKAYDLDSNQTFTVEIIQNNNHPTNPILIRQDDKCSLYSNLKQDNPALTFNRNDGSREYEEHCIFINGPQSSNNKSVLPQGRFSHHYIQSGSELKYRIDFQNSTGDTVFYLKISDSLSPYLDIATLKPGVSSHRYHIEFKNRELLLIFDSILLIDSLKNKELSRGYATFKLKNHRNLVSKIQTKNTAKINFNLFDSIVTNTVFTTVFDTIQIYIPKDSSKIGISTFDSEPLTLYPNPVADRFYIQLDRYIPLLTIEIYDSRGREVDRIISTNEKTVMVDARLFTSGTYIIRCMNADKLIAIKKLIIQ